MVDFNGVPLRGPWIQDEVATFLDGARIPMRIAVTSSTGCPIVLSVWFIREGGSLFGATRPTSTLVRYLDEHGECGFEISPDAPPYHGVRGKATVTLLPARGAEILDRLLVRYLGSTETPLGKRLRDDAEDEICFKLDPTLLVSWDYRKRMASSTTGAASTK